MKLHIRNKFTINIPVKRTPPFYDSVQSSRLKKYNHTTSTILQNLNASLASKILPSQPNKLRPPSAKEIPKPLPRLTQPVAKPKQQALVIHVNCLLLRAKSQMLRPALPGKTCFNQTQNNMTYQLVSPKNHRRNTTKEEVKVFKDYFIVVLCGTDVTFLMQLLCQLLLTRPNPVNLNTACL